MGLCEIGQLRMESTIFRQSCDRRTLNERHWQQAMALRLHRLYCFSTINLVEKIEEMKLPIRDDESNDQT